MKKKSIILTLAITLVIGISATAYAATSNSTYGNNSGNRTCSSIGNGVGMGMGRTTNFRGHDILTDLLKSKGVTDTEINSALDSGKSMYDLLKDKGLTDEEIKNYMLDERTKSIDKAVSEGSLTAEQGAEIKTNIKENSANCTTPGQGNGKMRGQGNMHSQRSTN